ncbi:MAG: hypothetical protein QOH88_2150 [Verrucomicrobiota bacterium]|jgi:predicted DCC family thiol-disulfide oxidoreductase YuxK
MPHRTVRDAPSKPLLIFDGNCHFCRRWIERWRELTDGGVEYAPSQEVAGRFPEIPAEAFDKSVQFVHTDGTVYSGAEAVIRSLGRKWMIWCYERMPGFAPITETAYGLVARNRIVASFFTRLLWGNDVRQATYFISRRWFFRSLGAIYLIAFLSLWGQLDGLIGEHGILPISEYLKAARAQFGGNAPSIVPTLCWLNSSDAFLRFLCGAGAILSILLIAGLLPVIALILLFVLYLSLTVAGQDFLSFQWDILLLETGFLAIFFAPVRWRMSAAREAPFSRVGHFLLKLLLFKLMLMSGVVKLTSGDDSWWNLTALDYHYETQPLPTILGWWAHQAPEWFRKLSTFFVLSVECVVPFFIWAPRRLRHIACALLVLLQILIALTGNYCFFNLLTIALCLLLIDDAVLKSARGHILGPRSARALPERLSTIAAVGVLVVMLPLNAMFIFSAFRPRVIWPGPIVALHDYVAPVRAVSGYGLFRVMTKSRPEIVLEGSADGIEWLSYDFKWNPGRLNDPPHWVAPHQPRLDWQMWFAALGNYRQNPWFVRLVECLLLNKPEVTRLVERNPFPDHGPRYVRAVSYEYHFTSWAEHNATGDWWKRESLGEYFPAVSLNR